MAKGYIYIMTNPCLKDMVKIGYATNVEERRKQLSTTALPYDYEIFATYETSGKPEDKKLHKLIDNLNPDLRVSKNREFFVMSAEDAYELLEAIATISGSQDKLQKKQSNATSTDSKKTQKPPVNFAKCNIPVGAELVYVDDPTVRVTVATERKVQYNNELTSLSAIVQNIKGIQAAAGPNYFTYNGEIVSEIVARTQWKAD